MWWVMLPGGDVENEGATFLRTSKPAILQGRQFSTARMLKRLNAEKQKAVSAEDYERAAKLRDVIKVVSQDGGER